MKFLKKFNESTDDYGYEKITMNDFLILVSDNTDGLNQLNYKSKELVEDSTSRTVSVRDSDYDLISYRLRDKLIKYKLTVDVTTDEIGSKFIRLLRNYGKKSAQATIKKIPDEYYTVVMMPSPEIKVGFYKCDEIEGVIKCLEDIL